MARNAGSKARATAAPSSGPPKNVQVRALTAIAGMEWACRQGEFVQIPRAEAESLVARGFVEYALTPLERAVQLLKSRGCGVALPRNPDPEVQAAVAQQGARTAEL